LPRSIQRLLTFLLICLRSQSIYHLIDLATTVFLLFLGLSQ
jgi:hypothetical protein